ncbi:diguanylate cyclase [Propionivibrio sp.]|uniref:diguanylate cyclase n=1 Tax=Propionivibrio sp. TaxID=2212460 RepID=UPI00260B3E9B|nr:diguanylate cyclase [Propionivibrio sp.]
MNKAELSYTFAKEHVIRASALLSLLMPQASGIGIGVKGLDGRYLLVSKALETLFGKSLEQMTQLTDNDLFPPALAARLYCSDQQICAGAAASSDELDLSINGQRLHCLWLKFPVMGADGEILSIGTIMLDINRQEEAEDMRQALERLQQSNQELQRTLVELDRLASTDKLTCAWNRRRLEETVLNEMERLRRYDHPLSLLIIDIDLFKLINDDHGHVAGDQVLAELATVVQATLRITDSLTRWGGDEFVVLSPNTTLSSMAMLAERLHKTIARTLFPAVKHLTVSIGVAECICGENWEQWFKRADAALYRAKACGRNQVQIAPETPQRVGIGENVSANFVQLAWHPAYECGLALIDTQHQRLFRDANDLLAAILSGRPANEVAALIDALIRDVVQHFKDEEALITAAGYPDAAQHAAIHRRLVDSASVLIARFHSGTLPIGELFQYLANDLVARHMLGADREFFPYLDSRRQSATPTPLQPVA